MAHVVRFDCYEADLDAGQLRRRGIKVRLPTQSFQVLASLLEHPGEVVTRDILQNLLWNGEVFVDFESNLNTVIARLREALADSASHPRFIETLPKHGYRFIGTVSETQVAAPRAFQVRPRLLVLPFANLTGDPGREYFSDAMTDEIITGLAGLGPDRLAVIARGTSLYYKGNTKDLESIRHELNVDYFIEGGVLRAGDELSMNIQLIQASDMTHLFARKYEGARRNLFGMQDCIAHEIAAHLPALAGRERSPVTAAVRGPVMAVERLAAYDEYVQGKQQLVLGNVSRDRFVEAKQHLEKAVALDPEYAPAHDALAEACWYLGYFGFVSPRKAFAAGIVHALRALEIDHLRAETHALLGQFHKIAEYNWSEVHREMSLAQRLNPYSPEVKTRYAVSELMPHGQLEEAMAELERAIEYDPLSLLPRSWLGIVLILSRQFERGLREGQKLLEIDAASPTAYFVLGVCQRYVGNYKEALDSQRKAVAFSGGSAIMLGWLGLTLAGSGEIAEANTILDRLHEMQMKSYVPPSSFAWIHIGLNDYDTAFKSLDRAVEECDQMMMPIKSYGFFDPIRSDPRFAALLRKMNLA